MEDFNIKFNSDLVESQPHATMIQIADQPLVSIIITVFNKEKYVYNSILSIVNQSWQNKEIIIVDDFSTDGSRDIIKNFENQKNIKIIYNKENMGCYISRNIGIENAIGKYLCFHDSDDYCMTTKIEKQVICMEMNNLIMCGTNIVRSHLTCIDYESEEQLLENLNDSMCIGNNKSNECCKMFFGFITLMFRKTIFDKYGKYLEYKKGMDMEFAERILFYENGIKFNTNECSWDFFNEKSNLIYQKIDELTIICPEINNSNLTISEKNSDFITNREWRECYDLNFRHDVKYIYYQLKNIIIFNHNKKNKRNVEIKNTNRNHSISLVILVRNNKEYLKESVGSLVSQTNQNWECIIINDGSMYDIEYDDCLEKTDMHFMNKIKIINFKKWKGIIKCHRIGVMQSKFDIIGILDCDDKLSIDAVDSVLSIYNDSEQDNIFVYSNFYYCDDKFNIIKNGYAKECSTSLLNERCGNALRTYKKKYYYLTEGFDDDLIFGAEDQDILWKIDRICSSVYLNKCIYYYRQNIYSLSSLSRASRYSYFLAILKNIQKIYNNLNFYIVRHNDKNISLYSNAIHIINFDIGEYPEYKNIYLNKKIFVGVAWDYAKNKLVISNGCGEFNLERFKKIHINSYFNNIYIINMKKDLSRKERIKNIFAKYDISCEFIEAVCGKDDPYNSDYINNYKDKLKSPGTYGYCLSMIKIFEDAITKKYNKILVCDDDIILHNDFINKFDEYIKSVPYSWKVLFMGISGPWSFNPNTFIYNYFYDDKYVTNLIGCDGSFCVGYDVTILQTLIDVIKQFNMPCDTAIIKYLNQNTNIEKYAFYPQLVIADTTKESDIINYQEESDILNNYMRNHYRFMVNLQEFDLNSMEKNNYEELYKV